MHIHFLTLVTSVVEMVDDDAILELCTRLLTSREFAVDMEKNAEEKLRRERP